MTDTDFDTASSIPGTATYINYCFFTGHIICAYVCRIYHSSLLRYCLVCALFQPLVVSKFKAAELSSAMLLLGPLSMRAARAPLNGAAQCDILRSPSTGLVCHSPEINWETRKRPESTESPKKNQMAQRLRSDFRFGPVQNEHLYGPNLRSLAPTGQRSARSTGPSSEKSCRPSSQCRGLEGNVREIKT